MFLLSWMAVGFLLQVSPTSSRLRETEEGTEQNQVSQQEKKNTFGVLTNKRKIKHLTPSNRLYL